MDVVVTPTFPFISLNYKETYKSATLKYDQLAMKYLSYVDLGCCSVLQWVAIAMKYLSYVRFRVVAVCCSVMQCVAVCCSELPLP